MGSVSSTGLSTLLQTLSAESPALSSALSSPNVLPALEKASPGDLVHLSDLAVQLQEVGLLFGSSQDGTSTSLTPFSETPDAASNSILQALESSLAGQAGQSTSTSAAQTASVVSSAQAQEMDALFGGASTVAPSLNTLA
jgi:hypothetical protein